MGNCSPTKQIIKANEEAFDSINQQDTDGCQIPNIAPQIKDEEVVAKQKNQKQTHTIFQGSSRQEIVVVAFGEFSSQKSNKFFKVMRQNNQFSNTFFHEDKKQNHINRSILIGGDIDFSDMPNYFEHNIMMGKEFMSKTGNPDIPLTKTETDIYEPIQDLIRKEVEMCDRLQGFVSVLNQEEGMITHLACNSLLTADYNGWSNKHHFVFSNFTGPNGLKNPYNCYNTILSLQQLIENNSMVFCTDSETLQKVENFAQNKLDPFVEQMIGITSPFYRKMSMGNMTSMLKQEVSMMPFPRIKFMMPTVTPVKPTLETAQYDTYLSLQLAYRLSGAPRQEVASCLASQNILSMVFYPKIFEIAAHNACESYNQKYKNKGFFANISEPHENCYSDSLDRDTIVSYSNSKAIKDCLFNPICSSFANYFRMKLNRHKYSDEYDDMSFTEAESNLHDQMSEYVDYHNGGYYDNEE